MKYHIKNKNNKREMKKVRIKPIPLSLMKEVANDFKRIESRRGNLLENNVSDKTS